MSKRNNPATESKENRPKMWATAFRGKLIPIVRATLSVAVIAALIYHIGSAQILSEVEEVHGYVLIIAVVMLASNVFIVTPRWVAILNAFDQHVRGFALLGSVTLGFLFNQLLPTGAGGDVVRVMRARKLGVPLSAAIHSVLLDRASGIFASLVGAVVLLPFADARANKMALIIFVFSFVCAALAGYFALWIVTRLPTAGIAIIWSIQREIGGFGVALRILLRQPKACATVFGLAIANQCLPVAATWLLASDLGVSMDALDIAIITFIATLASIVPLSIAGWGLREGTLVFLLGAYGVSPAIAFTVSILYGVCQIIAAIPGAVILFGGVEAGSRNKE